MYGATVYAPARAPPSAGQVAVRLIAILLVLAVLALLVALTARLIRRRQQIVQRVARIGGHERVLNEIVMVEVATNDPEWTSKVRAARDTAAERAFELNTHSVPGPP